MASAPKPHAAAAANEEGAGTEQPPDRSVVIGIPS
jgi:hypothetical protein